MTISDLARGALATLREEVGDHPVDLAHADQATDAALELLQHPRREWPVPRTSWESLVVASALTIVRLEGQGRDTPRPMVAAALREALRHYAAREAETTRDGRARA
jgi:hypothetical protein